MAASAGLQGVRERSLKGKSLRVCVLLSRYSTMGLQLWFVPALGEASPALL